MGDPASIIYSRLSLFDYEYRYAEYEYDHNITHKHTANSEDCLPV